MSLIEPPVASPNQPWTYRPVHNSRRKIIRTALLKALDEDLANGDGTTTKAIDRFARSMVASAIDGSVDAGKFVADRVDGKQLANAELTGEADAGPIVDDARLMRALALLVAEMKQRERAIELKPMSEDAHATD